MTINARFTARIVMPGEEFDAADVPADSLQAFCERPAGAPRATMLEAPMPAPVPSDPLPAPVAVVAAPAPVEAPVIEEKPRRGWKRKK